MPVKRSRKTILADVRTGEILEAARRIFSVKGFDRATIHDIASAAGIAKGTVYLYYPSKRAVFAAALDEELARQAALTRQALARAERIEEQVRSFIRAKAEYYERRREAYSLFFSHGGRALASRERLGRKAEECRLAQVRDLRAALRRAAQQRRIRPGPVDLMAFSLFDLTRGLVERRVRGWSAIALDKDVDATFELFWKGVKNR